MFFFAVVATFNNKLKELRKRHGVVVPVQPLVDILLEQFDGQLGDKFKTACAVFCQNQAEAMKLLQNKLKHDKFNLFLNVICHFCR